MFIDGEVLFRRNPPEFGNLRAKFGPRSCTKIGKPRGKLGPSVLALTRSITSSSESPFDQRQKNGLIEAIANPRVQTFHGLSGRERQRAVLDLPGQTIRFENLLEKIAECKFPGRHGWKLHASTAGTDRLLEARAGRSTTAKLRRRPASRAIEFVSWRRTTSNDSVPPQLSGIVRGPACHKSG